MYGKCFLGWPSEWIALGAVLAVLPLAIWRGKRLAYFAVWCLAAAAAVGFLWARDRGSSEEVLFQFARYAPPAGEGRALILWSSTGEVGVGFRYFRLEQGASPGDFKPGLLVAWDRRAGMDRNFPGQRKPLLNLWGIKVVLPGTGNPGAPVVTRWWGLTAPSWLALVVLAIPVLLLARRAARHRVSRRPAAGCCGKCGYDLRAHAVGAPCPECGTPKTVPPAGLKLPTATETQGKPA